MKKLTILVILYLTACIAYCQDFKPYYYGNVNDSIVYCFTFPQTKAIAAHIVNSKYCSVLDSLQSVQIADRDSLINFYIANNFEKDLIIDKHEILNDNNNKIIDEHKKTIAGLNKKIKLLKIERLAYPIAVLIAIFTIQNI